MGCPFPHKNELSATKSLVEGQGGSIDFTGRSGSQATFARSRVSVDGSLPRVQRALSFLGVGGRAFGLQSTADLRVIRQSQDASGFEHACFQQSVDGIDVVGGQICVHMRGGEVTATNGRLLKDVVRGGARQAIVSAADAKKTVVALLARDKQTGVSISTPTLRFVNDRFLGGRQAGTHLAWFMRAQKSGYDGHFYVSARTNRPVLMFNNMREALNRKIYDSNGSSTVPGTQVGSDVPNSPPVSPADAVNAFAFASDWHAYMAANAPNDAFNSTIQKINVRHLCSSNCSSENNSLAYYDEAQDTAVVASGYATQDIIGHELAHQHIEAVSGLFGYMQSGALAEHFADVFGEAIDQFAPTAGDLDAPTTGNVLGHTTLGKGYRWYIGESATAALRNMQDPSVYGDPKSLGDTADYQCSPTVDNGGIHSNNGIPNRAFQMLVDGNTVPAVTAIGMTKALAIESRTLSTYMLSGSDFTEYMNSMKSACADF